MHLGQGTILFYSLSFTASVSPLLPYLSLPARGCCGGTVIACRQIRRFLSVVASTHTAKPSARTCLCLLSQRTAGCATTWHQRGCQGEVPEEPDFEGDRCLCCLRLPPPGLLTALLNRQVFFGAAAGTLASWSDISSLKVSSTSD